MDIRTQDMGGPKVISERRWEERIENKGEMDINRRK
jgi:hypothetical protein